MDSSNVTSALPDMSDYMRQIEQDIEALNAQISKIPRDPEQRPMQIPEDLPPK